MAVSATRDAMNAIARHGLKITLVCKTFQINCRCALINQILWTKRYFGQFCILNYKISTGSSSAFIKAVQLVDFHSEVTRVVA